MRRGRACWSAEQTANLAGGAIWPLDKLNAVAFAAQDGGTLATHLDGARLLDAQVATGIRGRVRARLRQRVDRLHQKGLGCPVGAVLAGSRAFVADAWLLKRRWGGAMRQTGVLTSMCPLCARITMSHVWLRDHALAMSIGERLAALPVIRGVIPVETNIVIADLSGNRAGRSGDCPAVANQKNVTVTVVGSRRLRIVTHLECWSCGCPMP